MIFLADYTNRVQEINDYFDFIFVIDKSKNINLEDSIFEDEERLNQFNLSHLKNTSKYPFSSELKKTLKANAYLLLYNLIEGSVTAGIDAIFLAINQSDLKLNNLKKEMRELYLHFNMKPDSENQQQSLRIKDRTQLINRFNSLMDKKVEFKSKNKNNDIKIGYQAYLEKMGGEISGNIDAKKLEELAKKYGFTLPTTTIANELLIIKNKRNQLAHGEITFSEAGKDKSIEEMIALKNTVTQYFNSLMNNIKNYIENEEFKV
ncbi:MAE_28990/MAE_18760 family HEPN-like nuclease [Bernardetia sp. Wsw4-3y2]|uniref:MAE_28990/MAE_18760 family HEPN-like nuclease n=1 Tax=Bernardetia sp. Wsw4-3y2 TaxID=3127471 RepID=UPI0030D15706